ncbi:MAG: hypothetical protein FJZ01_17705 [Candidatus Sericytochromatia bacterium]|nr:hypothetical protein [Candidatus Tanganyikabacteria bacterium]
MLGRALGLGLGLGLGALAGYLLDPTAGRRRRALVRDKGIRSWHQGQALLRMAARDLEHRVQGVLAEAPKALQAEDVSDAVLVERVRARLGRVVSHPHALKVTALQGVVTLEGPILADEVDFALDAVHGVRGVRDLESRLVPHPRDEAERIPALQGGRHREPRPELLQENWAPAMRVAAGAGGAALFVRGLLGGGLAGTMLQAAGAALAARSIANMPIAHLLGLAATRRVIDVNKTFNIQAPLSEVFAFWTRVENFPLFMQHVRNVIDLGEGRTRWILEGPAGIPAVIDARVTRVVPDETIAWESVRGSEIAAEGFVRFQENADASTRVDVRICYNPPMGMLGHFLAWLFGDDPKHALEADIVRMKSLIEDGKTRAHGREVTLEEVLGS